jgi:tRNA threonylcarbamoyladenosine biosynthesis protein TsaE
VELPDVNTDMSPGAAAGVHSGQAAGLPPDSAAGLPPDSVVPTAAGMRALGARLATLLRPGDLVLLAGPLGAGKTTLVQGLGAALRVRGHVTSPTFVIARVHPSLSGGPSLVHVDAYRLGSLAEMDDLDLDLDGAVTVVEWGEGLAEGLSADRLEVTIGFAGRDSAGLPGRDPAAPPGHDSAGLPGNDSAGPPGDDRPPGENAPPAEGDEPRRVRIRPIGPRWTASEDEPAVPGEAGTARTQAARRA